MVDAEQHFEFIGAFEGQAPLSVQRQPSVCMREASRTIASFANDLQQLTGVVADGQPDCERIRFVQIPVAFGFGLSETKQRSEERRVGKERKGGWWRER